MASVYELAIQTSATETAKPALEILAVTKPASILELEIANNAATAASLIIGRPGNTPTTGTLVTATLPINRPPGGQVSTTSVAVTGWGTAPTIPAAGNQHRRVGLPAAIGAGWLGVWGPREMVLDPVRTGSLIIWTASVIGVLNVRIKWEE
jgi:hypothetical protein